MVTGFQLQHFVPERRAELDELSCHRFTSTVACRFAQHWILTATGSDAVWQPAVFTLTASAVKSPPSPIGPIPSLLTEHRICCSYSVMRIDRRAGALPLPVLAARSNVPPIPTPMNDRRAGLSLGMEHGLDHELFDLVTCGGEEHGDPGHVLCTRTLGQDGDGELLPGFYVDGRHPGAGIVVRVVPGQRVHDIGPERDFLRCPAHTFGHGIVQALRERDIGRDGEVHDRDARVLAQRHPELFGNLDIFTGYWQTPRGQRGWSRPQPPCRITFSTSGGRRMTASRYAAKVASARAAYTGSFTGFISLYWIPEENIRIGLVHKNGSAGSREGSLQC